MCPTVHVSSLSLSLPCLVQAKGCFGSHKRAPAVGHRRPLWRCWARRGIIERCGLATSVCRRTNRSRCAASHSRFNWNYSPDKRWSRRQLPMHHLRRRPVPTAFRTSHGVGYPATVIAPSGVRSTCTTRSCIGVVPTARTRSVTRCNCLNVCATVCTCATYPLQVRAAQSVMAPESVSLCFPSSGGPSCACARPWSRPERGVAVPSCAGSSWICSQRPV